MSRRYARAGGGIADHSQPASRRLEVLELQRFLPYRLAVLADAVSKDIAGIYAERFDLTRQAWRILAVLGERGKMAARDLGRVATLDKMQISRGLAHLEARALVSREELATDRRNRSVVLTRKGRELYEKIVPLALTRERELLAALTANEVEALDRIVAKLMRAVRQA
ncbi:MAG: winged helix DNA-binding protein [Hyphomicrobiaceae bacterium]|nr:winged helix DNA-binding protein [Hyphomicrobiaceae bacterium]